MTLNDLVSKFCGAERAEVDRIITDFALQKRSMVESLLPALVQCATHKISGDKMNGTQRSQIKPGMRVAIVLKKDQRSGALTEGIVKDILTNSATHPHGIKVRLVDGQVGRVKEILSAQPASGEAP